MRPDLGRRIGRSGHKGSSHISGAKNSGRHGGRPSVVLPPWLRTVFGSDFSSVTCITTTSGFRWISAGCAFPMPSSKRCSRRSRKGARERLPSAWGKRGKSGHANSAVAAQGAGSTFSLRHDCGGDCACDRRRSGRSLPRAATPGGQRCVKPKAMSQRPKNFHGSSSALRFIA